MALGASAVAQMQSHQVCSLALSNKQTDDSRKEKEPGKPRGDENEPTTHTHEISQQRGADEVALLCVFLGLRASVLGPLDSREATSARDSREGARSARGRRPTLVAAIAVVH